MTRRGFAIEFTSLARARMTPAQRGEVYAWANERQVRVYIWLRARDRRWEAVLTLHDREVTRQSAVAPFDAFRSAAAFWDAPALVSLLTGPEAA